MDDHCRHELHDRSSGQQQYQPAVSTSSQGGRRSVRFDGQSSSQASPHGNRGSRSTGNHYRNDQMQIEERDDHEDRDSEDPDETMNAGHERRESEINEDRYMPVDPRLEAKI